MAELDILVSVLGWCSLINILLLTLTTLILAIFRTEIVALHGRLFGVESAQLNMLYLTYLSYFKLITLCFFLVPYLSLKIVT